jgi:hypothetical protein
MVRAVFGNHIYEREEFKMNLNGSVQAQRVSRIPGRDLHYSFLAVFVG